MNFYDNRRTGRTTRMLTEVVKTARQGKYIMVACASLVHGNDLYDRLLKYENTRGTNRQTLKVYVDGPGGVEGEVSIVPIRKVDLRSGRVDGAYPMIKIYADHYAIEEAIPWALNEWVRWNEGDD